MSTSFTAYVCILPVKPHDPIGPNERRHPLVHPELFLTRSAAVEFCYFENADEPAPDKISWIVREIEVPALRDYWADEPYLPPADREDARSSDAPQ